jgi:hypothetical protein
MEKNESRRLAVSLEHLAAEGADVSSIANAVIASWTEIEAAVASIIGKRGVSALYERSLYITWAAHPWLAPIDEGLGASMDLPALKAVLMQQDSITAAAGGGAHLQALYEVLGSLIGATLTEKLLRPIWDNSLSGPAAQEKLR